MPSLPFRRANSNVDALMASNVVGVRDARAQFSVVVDVARTDRERVVITEHGRAAAAVVPIRDWRILDYFDRLGIMAHIEARLVACARDGEVPPDLLTLVKEAGKPKP